MKRFYLKCGVPLALLLAAVLLFTACAGGAKKPDEQTASADTAAPKATAAPTEAPTEAPSEEPQPTAEPERNPIVCTVGTAEFPLSEYVYYYQMGSADYSGFDGKTYARDILIDHGIRLTKAKELGITLSDYEMQQAEEFVNDAIENVLEYIEIDPGITNRDEIRQAKLEAYDRMIREDENSFFIGLEDYKADYLRRVIEHKLMDKLFGRISSEITATPEEIEEYIRVHTASDKEDYEYTPTIFANVYSGYLRGTVPVPLYIPSNMFTVKCCLIEFENADELIYGGVAGRYSAEGHAKIDEITSRLEEGISLDEFISSYVENGDYNDDAAFVPQPGLNAGIEDPQYRLRKHGYLMHTGIRVRYSPGFGEAACVLYYGDGWKSSASTVSPIEEYGIEFFTTSDGMRIAKVESSLPVSGAGTFFLFISETLPAGTVHIDMNDTGSEEYLSLERHVASQRQGEHFAELYEIWKKEIACSFNDEIIDAYHEKNG